MGLSRVLVLDFMLFFIGFVSTRAYAYGFIRNGGGHRLRHVSRLSSLPDNVFSVDSFGAKGDGSDDSQAFMKAWKQACLTATSTLVVPKNKNYLVKPLVLSGPCKSNITLKILGTVKASSNQADYNQDTAHWLMFQNVPNLKVEGGGTIDGNGNIWWKNSCKINKALPCKKAPTAVTFYQCNNLVVRDIRIQNGQQMHVVFQKSIGVQALNLVVTAPGTSPNTDGIHVTDTQDILIADSLIGTGDDCISIVSGAQRVRAMNITCGPGHGISIGSLGEDGSEEFVSDVVVDGARLSGTTNGVRIKTWQGGSGKANNIIFRNIDMNNVKNPIIIDQNYCDKKGSCAAQKSAVQISDVLYQNIKGTSGTSPAISLDCSQSHPCQGIIMQDINLVGGSSGAANAVCENVKVTSLGKIAPICP